MAERVELIIVLFVLFLITFCLCKKFQNRVTVLLTISFSVLFLFAVASYIKDFVAEPAVVNTFYKRQLHIPTEENQIICKDCGSDKSNEYCKKCGHVLQADLTNICKNCGKENEPESKYCVECGEKMP